jgi:hypothetical protein
MNTETLTLTIMILGSATVGLSIWAAYVFLHTQTRSRLADLLSKALGWQLIGESVLGMGTLVFSVAAYTGVLEGWSIEMQSALRFVMFFATAATTFHLVRTIKRL